MQESSRKIMSKPVQIIYLSIWLFGAAFIPWLLYPITVTLLLKLFPINGLVETKDLIAPFLVCILIGVSLPLTYFKDRWEEYTTRRLNRLMKFLFVTLPIVSVLSIALFLNDTVMEKTNINQVEVEISQLISTNKSLDLILDDITNKYKDVYEFKIESLDGNSNIVLISKKINNSLYYQTIITWVYGKKAEIFSRERIVIK